WALPVVRAIVLGAAGAGLVVAAWVLLLRRQIRKQTAELRAHFAREAELERSLQEHRRLEAVGRLVGGIAHDFNNLLTVIVSGGELVAGALPEGHPGAEMVGAIRGAAERGVELSRQLLTFAREKPTELAPLDLNAAVRGAEVLVRPTVGGAVRVVAEYGADVPPVLADPGLLAQVLVNLAANARDAMPHGGELAFRTSAERIGGAAWARLTVSDTGCGMSAETQARIFEPFFTTKAFGKGTGLGLSTVYGIVRNLGGTIRVRSAPDQGAAFTIDLPAAPLVPPAAPEPAAPPAARAVVLLVDDDPAVRGMCAAALRQYGFQVVATDAPHEAVELVRTARVPFDVLVTDAMMPVMSGPELVAAVRLVRPDMRVLVISGYPREDIPHTDLLRPTDAFLQKPFTPVHLAGQVHTILGGVSG
ncbi:MAG TPA: ATP-binding protein, partial [Gemmata sp.]